MIKYMQQHALWKIRIRACKKGKDSKEKNLKEKEDFEQNAAHQ